MDHRQAIEKLQKDAITVSQKVEREPSAALSKKQSPLPSRIAKWASSWLIAWRLYGTTLTLTCMFLRMKLTAARRPRS
jgi:hypothetical protein